MFFIFVCFFLENVGVYAGSTGDIEEGEWFILMYLLIKGAAAFVRGGFGIAYATVTRRSITLSSIFWSGYALILLLAISIKNKAIGETKYPYDVTGFAGVNLSIIMLLIDTLVFLLFSFVVSIICYKNQKSQYLLAVVWSSTLLGIFIIMIFTRTVGKLVS